MLRMGARGQRHCTLSNQQHIFWHLLICFRGGDLMSWHTSLVIQLIGCTCVWTEFVICNMIPTVHDSLAPMVTTLCRPNNMRTFYFQDMTGRVDWFFDFIIWNSPSNPNLLFDIISTKFIVSWNDFVMEIKGWYKITWYEFFCISQSLNSFTETISVVDHWLLNRHLDIQGVRKHLVNFSGL